jgi:hypothetical protein
VSLPRIQFIAFKGKRILLVDLSNPSAAEVGKTVRAFPEVVTTHARGSLLVLADFTEARLDQEALRTMKEAAVFNKPYIKKTAWVGAKSFPEEYRKTLESFSRREFPTFKNRQDALEWLVEAPQPMFKRSAGILSATPSHLPAYFGVACTPRITRNCRVFLRLTRTQ